VASGKGDSARLAALVERCDSDVAHALEVRADGDALALDVGGELALRWRIAVVRALMADPPDGDAVREAYGEIVDRYRDDPASLAIVRPLGDEIRQLEAAGSLPSTLVARSDRKRK